MLGIIADSIADTAKLIPFLLLTYVIMEYLEHRASAATTRIVRRAGKWGPAIGAVAGVVPQCGFSAAAASLYAGRVITLGTLLAILLSSSDEMLPIMISEKVSPLLILQILGIKIIVGAAMGFAVDALFRGEQEEHGHIHEMCEHDHCHCEEGIIKSAIRHTLQIAVFILVINFILNLVLERVGAEALSQWIWNRPVIGQLISGVIGLIPNCASSVAITQLYLEGAMSFGAMMSGLLVNTGVGLLILCRVNRHKGENLKIIGLLYGISVVSGILIGLLPIG